MATWITDEGYIVDIQMSRTGQLIHRKDVQNWVGDGFAIFYLDDECLMLVDLSAKGRGLKRNVKAMKLLRLSTLEPFTEIFGDVLIVRRDELSVDDLLSPE